MDVFTLIGLGFVLYIFLYVGLLTFIDCDLRLFWCIYYGKGLEQLKNKVIWVTGASSGIGEFLSIELARNGASVVLSARSLSNLERVKERCIEAGGSIEKLFILPMDVTETEKHQEHFNRVIDRFGKGYFKTLFSEKLGGKIAITLLCPGPTFSNLLPACFTSKPGETFGQLMNQDDKRMTTERCAHLCAIAIANKLDEAWIGLFPIVPLCYLLVYHPNIAKQVALSLGTKGLLNMRDSRQTVKKDA